MIQNESPIMAPVIATEAPTDSDIKSEDQPLPKCTKCSKPISSGLREWRGRAYHEDCVKIVVNKSCMSDNPFIELKMRASDLFDIVSALGRNGADGRIAQHLSHKLCEYDSGFVKCQHCQRAVRIHEAIENDEINFLMKGLAIIQKKRATRILKFCSDDCVTKTRSAFSSNMVVILQRAIKKASS